MMGPDTACASTCGIVLSAGLSRRMGRFKPLLPIDGERVLVEVVVDSVRLDLGRIIVVVGHRADEIRRRLAKHPVEVVENPRYRDGMLSSVQCGVAAAGAADGYLFCLGDQPELPAGLVRTILDRARRTTCGIALPVWSGRGGHPVYVSSRYRDEILQLTGMSGGLRAVTRGHPADTVEIPVESAAVVEDLDTPEQYDRLRARLGAGGGKPGL